MTSPIDFDLATAEFTVKRDGEPDWSVTDWFDSLSDNEGVRDLIWQLPAIALRPRVSWDRASPLYSTMGNNGKGTLISVLRNLVGVGNWC